MSLPSLKRPRSSSPDPAEAVETGSGAREDQAAYQLVTSTTIGANTMMAVSAQDLAHRLWPEPGQGLMHHAPAYPLQGVQYASHGSPHATSSKTFGMDIGGTTWHQTADQGPVLEAPLAHGEPAAPGASRDSWRQTKLPGNFELEGFGSEYQGQLPAYAGHDDSAMGLRFAMPQLEDTRFRLADLPPRAQTTSPFPMSTGAPSLGALAVDEAGVGLQTSGSRPDYPAAVSTGPASGAFPLLTSPRQAWREGVAATAQRGRASASPRLTVHPPSDPTGLGHGHRWSAGPMTPGSPQYNVSPTYHSAEAYHQLAARHLSLHGSPVSQQARLMPPLGHMQAQPQAYLTSPPLSFDRPHTLWPPQFLPPEHRSQLETPPPLPSHSFHQPRLGGADPKAHRPYTGAELATQPDLFGSLRREPSAPPPEDMNTTDPELVPHEQDLRFEGDLYTPRWVRGQGNKREGWCGICEPGRWLVLKNSAFWYDKSFAHGVAATGAPFQGPQATRRMDGNPDVWEGFCGNCHDWIALVSSKKKGTTWFRHAYKCQAQSKPRDQSKRRREQSPADRPPTPSVKRPKALPLSPGGGGGGGGLGPEAIEPVMSPGVNLPPPAS